MANATIDKDKTLYLACDASQIAAAHIVFKLGEDGQIVMITTCTRIFIRSSRNKSAAFRELLAINNSISLSLLTRQKFNNNKLLEISLYL